MNASLIKELRTLTGAGMVDCKNALTETNGDLAKAEEFLREKGLSAAAKKAGRIAAEGLVNVLINENSGVIVEINSETDFVAKNAEFKSYVEKVAEHIASSSATCVDELLNEKWEADLTVQDALSQKISVIGENLSIRRFEKFIRTENSTLVSYIHGGGKVAVLLELLGKSDNDLNEVGKNICMQIAAMSPKFVSRDDVSQDFIDKERQILLQLTLNEGKPENIANKIVEGRLNKELKEVCLLEQEYVKDNEMNIATYLAKSAGANVKINRFVRFETGEGLDKKNEDFAAEVQKTLGQ